MSLDGLKILCSWQNKKQDYKKNRQTVFFFMHPDFDSDPKKSDKDGKTLLRTHWRVCFASTRKVSNQARPVFIPISLGIPQCFKGQRRLKTYSQTPVLPFRPILPETEDAETLWCCLYENDHRRSHSGGQG